MTHEHHDEGHGPRPVPLSGSGAPAPAGTSEVRESVLDNGVRVLSERIPGVRSVSTGIWVRQGAAHEGDDQAGRSHLLEHMVFKGTRRRTPRDIALSLERLGGSLDAYTTREHTAYQARVLDAHLPEALDVLADLITEPLLRPEDLALERNVVLEEIAQVEDTPDDLVFELHGDALWNGHPYGRSILGTRTTVAATGADHLRELHSSTYVGRRMLLAAAGNVDHDDLVARAETLLGGIAEGRPAGWPRTPGEGAAGDRRVDRPSVQSHVVFGTRVPAHGAPERRPLILVMSALGGGMSSRLFQRVREELGLCYSVFTWHSFYGTAGVAGVYVGTGPDTEHEAVSVIREELDRLAREGLPEPELDDAKKQLEGQIMLSLESTGSRLYRLASAALHDEPWLGLDELLARVDAVTPADVADVAARFLPPERQLVLRLGPV